MSEIKRCAGCRHWDPDPTYTRGRCLLVSEPANPGETVEANARPMLRAAGPTAYLETSASFGCTSHEQAT